MKKFEILLLLSMLIGCVSIAIAQKEASYDSTYYYYKGEQIYIPLNKRYIVVYYNDTVVLSLGDIIGEVSIDEDEIVYSDSKINTHRLLVDLEEQDYSTSLIALKNNLNIIDVEPVVGIDRKTKLSRLFYVKLINDSDYVKLVSISNLNKVVVVEKVSSCDKWYELQVDNVSSGNSLEMANYFWNTGLFDKVDPGFLFDFRPNIDTCVTDSIFYSQWGLHSIHSCEAWNLTTGSSNVKVAVIDQGADLTHREMNHVNVYYSYDALSGSSPAHIYSYSMNNRTYYHGIEVSGIIFSNHNANKIAGVSPNASLINISHNMDMGSDRKVRKLATGINEAV